MSALGPCPQPSPEWIATTVLGIGLRQLFGRTVARNRPLFRGRIADLGSSVYAEVLLLPSLAVVLRVVDDDSGEELARSEPDDFTTVDMDATRAAQMLRRWQADRASAAGATPPGPEA